MAKNHKLPNPKRANSRSAKNKKFRLVLVNDETFQEQGSVALSKKNVFLVGSIIFFLIGGILLLLFWLTPLGNIFGGETITANGRSTKQELRDIYLGLDSLEQEVNAQEVFIDNVQKMINGDVERAEDVEDRQALSETENQPIGGNGSLPELSDATQEVIEINEYETEMGAMITSNFTENMTADDMQFICPLKGIISDTFSTAKAHYGIDIVAPKGSVIKAVQNGTVITANWSADEGHVIGVQHNGNLISFYKHNSSLLKQMGDVVRAGEAIARIGNTGKETDGPHLHFELWRNGSPINPQRYIQF